MTDYLQRILRARVYDVAVETPLDPAPNLSRRLSNTVLLKREDLQPVFSFKLRGAYNRMAQLTPSCSGASLRRALAITPGRRPECVPSWLQSCDRDARHDSEVKIRAVRATGAEVVLHTVGPCKQMLSRGQAALRADGLTFIHPFDDPEEKLLDRAYRAQ